MKHNFLFLLLVALFVAFSGVASADLIGKRVTANQVTNTAAGNVEAVTVQAAINELDTEKAALSGATFTGSVTPTGRMLMPVGQVDYFSTTGTAVVMGAISDGSTNMVAIVPTTTGLMDTCFDNGGTNNGTLRYTCATTKFAHIAITSSFTPATANDVFVTGVAKNGAVGTACKVLGTSSGTQVTTLHCVMSIAQNDTITLRIGNTTAARDATVKSLNIQAILM
ncbi:hypothetical protein UFOVP1367_6 [uncultured Caudovirales phage]|uniref:Uncharacterized protein n=1 Tax=uncultured Caudovirales phage TaxID=2100421 RepID=A0A6J5S238_9CAUD|nr:hypothetical protein KNT69_gp06 [uncultured Caudovirales phage]CAB4202296.1 hypothetical protein UFOVP1367_6 [uncultured Caudovirales phage]